MKEIADLKQQIKQLSNQNEKAQSEIYRLESILALVPPESLPKGVNYNIGGNTLRFKMATVMYVDIRGFKTISSEARTSDFIDELDQIFIYFNEIALK